MSGIRSPWPHAVWIGALSAAVIFFFGIRYLQDWSPLAILTLSFVWPLALFAFIFLSCNKRLEEYQLPDGPLGRGVSSKGEQAYRRRRGGLSSEGYLVIVAGPSILLMLSEMEAAAAVAGSKLFYLLMFIRTICLLVIILALIVDLPQLADDKSAITAKWLPSLSIASLILLLGGRDFYSYLTWALPARIFEINLAVRWIAYLCIGGLLIAFFLFDLRSKIAEKGLGISDRWAKLRAEADSEFEESNQVFQFMFIVGSFLWHIFHTLIYGLIQLVTLTMRALYDVVSSFSAFEVVFCSVIAALLTLALMLASLAPTATFALGASMQSSAYDFWVLLFFALLFAWIGSASVANAYLIYIKPKKAPLSVSVTVCFCVMGFWFASVVAVILVAAFHLSFPRYNWPGSIFLVLLLAVWTAFILWFVSRKSTLRWTAFPAVGLILCLWIYAHRDYYLLSPLSLEEVMRLSKRMPKADRPSPTAEPNDGASITAGTAMSTEQLAWLEGGWGYGTGCPAIVAVEVSDTELRITVGDNSATEKLTNASSSTAVTENWSFRRVSGGLEAISIEENLGTLNQCAP